MERVEQPDPESVHSRADLVRFLSQLAAYVGTREARGSVENADLARYLEVASGWLEDMDGYFLNRGERVPTDASWRLIAQILTAALIYE